MVRLIVDFWGESLGNEPIVLKNTVIMVTEKCKISEEVRGIYRECDDIDAALSEGNYLFRTSDDFLRGIIIGKAMQKSPGLLLYSSRPEVLKKYLAGSACKLEPWPNDFSSYHESEGFTLQPPGLPEIPVFSSISPEKKFVKEFKELSLALNIPKPPAKLDTVSYVENRVFKQVVNKEAKLPEALKLSPSVQQENFALSKSFNVKKNENQIVKPVNEEAFIDESSDFFKSSLQEIVCISSEKNELREVKTLADLYSIILKTVREISNCKPEIIESDPIRLRLENLATKAILNIGFFAIPAGTSINDLVDSKQYKVALIKNY